MIKYRLSTEHNSVQQRLLPPNPTNNNNRLIHNPLKQQKNNPIQLHKRLATKGTKILPVRICIKVSKYKITIFVDVM